MHQKTGIVIASMFSLALMPALTCLVQAQSANEDFQQAVAAYQQSPKYAAAEKVIKLAAAMEQLPPIPEEARKHFVMGRTMFKAATSTNDFSLARQEFGQSVRLAPWWPEARYNLALALEAAGNYTNAISSLKLYQLFKLSDAEARAVQDKIYTLEAKQEMAAREADAKAKESNAKAEQEVQKRRQEAAEKERLQSLEGTWEQRHEGYRTD